LNLGRTIHVDNKTVKLPKKVMLLLELLVLNANKIVTKDQIIDHIWSASDDFSDGSIRVYINNLKKYMQKNRLISIKGVGYKFIL
jgi:DNA-binding response OmpR family regulator